MLVVALDPNPVTFLRERRSHPIFRSVKYGLWLQRKCGTRSRIVASLSCRETEGKSASPFLDELPHYPRIGEMRLKRGQSLGRGIEGGLFAIRAYCDRLGIRLVSSTHVNSSRARLKSGELSCATQLLSKKLYCARPASGRRTLPWPPGMYTALPLESPLPESVAGAVPIDVRLKPRSVGGRFWWPKDAPPWLGFVYGPGDRRSEARYGREEGDDNPDR